MHLITNKVAYTVNKQPISNRFVHSV